MQSGYQVGQFVLERRLGEGGMAEVWLGRNVHLGSLAAVKFLNDQYASRKDVEERFLNEGRRQGALDHPNIVKVYGFDYAGGRSFLIMQYVDGEALDLTLQRTGPLTALQAYPIAKGILQALDFAHSRQIVHRDVKPSNILIDRQGTPYLGDFGIVLAVNEKRLTQTGTVMGTPHYMSPEQIARPMEVDQRSDIYSFGCVLYEMLTGAAPFDHVTGGSGDTDFAVKMAHVQMAPPLPRRRNGAIPEAVEAVVLRCLAKEPAHRYGSCGQVLAALGAALRGGPAAVQRPKRVWPWLAAGVAAVMAMGGGVAYWPEQPEVVSFAASPAKPVTGQSTLISWDVKNVREVYISGLGKQPPKGATFVKARENAVYGLTGRNGWKRVSRDLLLTVVPKVAIVRFELSKNTVKPNEPVELTWEVVGATEVTIGGSPVKASGSETVREPENASWTIRATGLDGTKVQERRFLEVVRPEVPKPVTLAPEVRALYWSPKTVAYGESATLFWDVTGATKVYINQSLQSARGSWTVKGVQRGIRAILVAIGPGGRTERAAELLVDSRQSETSGNQARIKTFRAEYMTANGGRYVNLHYDAPGASRITIYPEAGPVSAPRGIVSVFPTRRTQYKIYAVWPGGASIETSIDVDPRNER
jgi:hypothetical protein